MSLTPIQQLPDPVASAIEAGRRIVAGLRNDMHLSAAAVARIMPDPDALREQVQDRDVLIWIDPGDAETRGVFVMRRDQAGFAGSGYYVIFGFGPSANWLDYLEAVVDTFIAAGRSNVNLYYPAANALGQFGVTVLASGTVTGGLRHETPATAKAKIVAYRQAHS